MGVPSKSIPAAIAVSMASAPVVEVGVEWSDINREVE
jgi:hypothetical protein